MRVLDFGGASVAVAGETALSRSVAAFLGRATEPASVDGADLELRVRCGEPRLVLDAARRVATLTLPRRNELAANTLHIALLQAAARCLALVVGSDWALLHGCAASAHPLGTVVAVLDGGRGQGKTSLALGLALDGRGELIADEFLFARAVRGALMVSPARCLPWHVRRDMAPHLAPRHRHQRLLFPADLTHVDSSAPGERPLSAILVPTAELAAGDVSPVGASAARDLLLAAITDHRAKLLDPTLDHVSIFETAEQIVDADGRPLQATCAPDDSADVLGVLSLLPTFLVGIGRPGDIATSADAAHKVLENLR